MTLLERLIRDLKANGPKTAVLGVLLLVGLYFWLPPVWRAVAGPAEAGESSVAPAAEPATGPATSSAPPGEKPLRWADAEELRARDDLFRSAGPADVAANAFVFDGGFLPIDVEFGEDDPETKAALAEAAERAAGAEEAKAAAAESSGPPPLTLKSTLVGSNRRVAVINGRTYPEGATVAAAGRTWTLMNVEPRRVLLGGDGGTVELKIDPFASASAAVAERTLAE